MALIVDEYGDLEGLVTQSDLLEALVGDIPGSADADQRVVRREDGSWLIDGMVGIDELKQVLGISHLPGEDSDFHTLGGFVMARLNRVPMVADRITAGGYSRHGRAAGRPSSDITGQGSGMNPIFARTAIPEEAEPGIARCGPQSAGTTGILREKQCVTLPAAGGITAKGLWHPRRARVRCRGIGLGGDAAAPMPS